MKIKIDTAHRSAKNRFLWTIFFVFIGVNVFSSAHFQAQEKNQNFTEFKGKLVDSRSKTPLAFATLSVDETNISTITNSDGEFLLKVPNVHLNKNITVSFLGYQTKTLSVSELKNSDNEISLQESIMELSEIRINAPKDARTLVKASLDKKAKHYLDEETIMTAFYRETIKKRRRNASLSEAIVEIYKEPYSSTKPDKIKLIKARKSTDYNKLDTLAVKLQGGPYSTLYADMIKYPQFIFPNNNLLEYDFVFDKPTEINDRSVYVVRFKQHSGQVEPMYYGTLYIDVETFSLISAIYNLNVENREMATEMFVKKKPNKATVYPTEAAYRIDYRLKDGKWYYGYSNLQLTIKVIWKGRLFNSIYTLNSEMAITDWAKDLSESFTRKETLRPSVILSDEASGFSDPEFWGEYNIIEPDNSIESAIEKIKRQLERQKGKE